MLATRSCFNCTKEKTSVNRHNWSSKPVSIGRDISGNRYFHPHPGSKWYYAPTDKAAMRVTKEWTHRRTSRQRNW